MGRKNKRGKSSHVITFFSVLFGFAWNYTQSFNNTKEKYKQRENLQSGITSKQASKRVNNEQKTER